MTSFGSSLGISERGDGSVRKAALRHHGKVPLYKLLPATRPICEALHTMVWPKGVEDAALGV